MKIKLVQDLLGIGLSLVATAGAANFTHAQSSRDISQYNIFRPGENLNGYDPVSYFPEGGGQPAKGRPEIELSYMGVDYNFSTQENRDLFLQDPSKYEPTYGQWCAWAMSQGSTIKIDPLHYTVHGRRLHFFVGARAKGLFDRGLIENENSADGVWKNLSGEDPRK